jgi:pyruvate dehydrogenase E2 component (dihydrolipoamide acetyltransferase)
MKDVLVPDIGDFKDVEVIEVLVKPGDTVAKEQSLVSLESDKATMEIPAPEAGVVKELKVKVGDKVSEGSALLVLEPGGGAAAAAPKAAEPAKQEQRKPEPKAPEKPAPAQSSVITRIEPVPAEPRDAVTALPHASPSIRKFARELGVDLARVQGSGPKGRIVREDIQGFVKAVLSGRAAPAAAAPSSGFDVLAWPDVDFAKFGPVELKARSRIQKLSAANLHRNWVRIPHVTQFDEADITELESFRKANTAETEKRGFKLTMLAFMLKASVTALRQFPEFNASLDRTGERLVIKRY